MEIDNILRRRGKLLDMSIEGRISDEDLPSGTIASMERLSGCGYGWRNWRRSATARICRNPLMCYVKP